MAGQSQPRVFVVEDDDAVRDAVTSALRSAGYAVREESDGLGVAGVLSQFRPDAAILDVRLPTGPSGLAIARRIRSERSMPILFLTAAASVEDRLAGFEAGADDYLAKPFAVAELLARVKALLRRSGALASASWQVGDLVVDENNFVAVRGGRELRLTRTEFSVLVALGQRPGRVLSKTQLLAIVWGFEEYDPNLVEVHLSSLRRKLEANGEPRLIHTVRGAGYIMRVP